MSIIEFTSEEKQELALAIIQAAEVDEKLRDMANQKIGELLFHHVWANMDMLSPQAEVVEQAYLRLGFKPECRHEWEEIIDDGDEVKVCCKKCGESEWVEVPQ